MNLRSMFRQLPATAYLYALLAASLLSLYAGWAHYQREIGRRDILTAQAKAGEQAARDSLAILNKVQKPQTAAAVKWRTKWDSTGLRQLQYTLDSLKALGVPKPEIIQVLVPVSTLATANTAITACTLALQTCDQRVGMAQRGWDRAEDRIKLLEKQMPGRLTPWRHRAEGALVAEGLRALLRALK